MKRATKVPTAGELWLRNKTVRPCYMAPEMNAARLHDGWFATGDLFERDETGEFYNFGRADDMFVCNGRNIYPVEIESVLVRHPLVQNVCAAPMRNREDRSGRAARAARISRGIGCDRSRARHRASHAVPQLVSFAERLPEVGPGKVNRREVGRLLQAVHDRTA